MLRLLKKKILEIDEILKKAMYLKEWNFENIKFYTMAFDIIYFWIKTAWNLDNWRF